MSHALGARRTRATALAILLAATPLHAQSIVGRISGAVVDSTGGTLPGVTVTATEQATRLVRSTVTDGRGSYLFTHLPVGSYALAAELAGFKKVVRSGHALAADGSVTVNFRLELGGVTEVIEVISEVGESVNTTSGELARVIDQEQVQNLALNGRNYMELTTLIPGTPVLNDDPIGAMTGLGVGQSINGGRTNANLLTVDGGFNLDSGSNASQISNVGIDFIREVSIKTSNFSAEFGRLSGASINVVTRSGTNRLSGGVWEFHRNEGLDANNYFLEQAGVEKPPLDYNNFGWRLGGPLKTDKLFFFIGQEWKQVRRVASARRRTLPTRAERAGDFSGRGGLTLRDPRTGQPFPGNRVPADRITSDGRAIAAVFDRMEQVATTYDDEPRGNNALFQGDNPFDNRQDTLRLDWRVNDRHSVYGRFIRDSYDLIDPYGTFINSQLPTIPTNRVRPGRNYQVGHTWIVSPSVTHEVRATGSWNGQRVPPVGEDWKRDTYGFTFPQLYEGGGRFEDSIPRVAVSGLSSFEGSARSLLSPTTDISVSNGLTYSSGRHSLRGGLMYTRNRKDQNGRSQYAGDVSFSTSGNPNTTGNAFADALLGNFRSYTEFQADQVGFFRFSQIEAYVSDNWKVSRDLSLEIGLRYQYHMPIYTQANNIANFDPAAYDAARAVGVNPRNGTLNLAAGDRYNGILRAGGGVPEDELTRVPIGDDPAVLAVPAGAPRGLYDVHHGFMPRFSFAWTPGGGSDMAIRGGIGVYYDRPEGNLIFSQVNLPPYSTSARFENGNLSAPSGGRAGAVGALGTINALDPRLRVPRTTNWSLSVQRELGWGLFGEVAYVGNAGRNLLRQPDINAIPFDVLAANRARPSSQRTHDNALRPYAGYTGIRMRLSDAESNYHALQVYVAKRRGDFTGTLSYTFGKSLGNASGNGDQLDVGEDPFEGLRNNYGPTSHDRRHIFNASYIYRVPLFREAGGVAGALLGGWEVSGTTHFQTGPYLTVTGDTSIGGRRADYLGGTIVLPGSERGEDKWFDTGSFAAAPDDRRGNSGRGILQGPGLKRWNVSLRKRFRFPRDVRLLLQADVFNAFNNLNLNNPNTNLSSSSFGQISSAGPGRTMQLGIKLEF